MNHRYIARDLDQFINDVNKATSLEYKERVKVIADIKRFIESSEGNFLSTQINTVGKLIDVITKINDVDFLKFLNAILIIKINVEIIRDLNLNDFKKISESKHSSLYPFTGYIRDKAIRSYLQGREDESEENFDESSEPEGGCTDEDFKLKLEELQVLEATPVDKVPLDDLFDIKNLPSGIRTKPLFQVNPGDKRIETLDFSNLNYLKTIVGFKDVAAVCTKPIKELVKAIDNKIAQLNLEQTKLLTLYAPSKGGNNQDDEKDKPSGTQNPANKPRFNTSF